MGVSRTKYIKKYKKWKYKCLKNNDSWNTVCKICVLINYRSTTVLFIMAYVFCYVEKVSNYFIKYKYSLEEEPFLITESENTI